MSRLGPRTTRILAVLAEHPDGLPTAEIARMCDDGTAPPGNWCGVALCEQAGQGRVHRSGRAPGPGRPILWQIGPESAREPRSVDERLRDAGTRYTRSEIRARIRLASEELALTRRKMAALAKFEEGIEELEQVERELEAAGFNYCG